MVLMVVVIMKMGVKRKEVEERGRLELSERPPGRFGASATGTVRHCQAGSLGVCLGVERVTFRQGKATEAAGCGVGDSKSG